MVVARRILQLRAAKCASVGPRHSNRMAVRAYTLFLLDYVNTIRP